MNTSEAAPLETFAYVFLKHEPPSSASSSPTRSQSQLQSQSHASSPTRSEASRKRKRDDGSATTDFGVSTRGRTKALLSGQCFHCEMKPGPYSPMNVYHVIPKKSASYSRHLADGLLDFSLDDVNNSLLLCKICHTVFDDPEPGWTLLPTDLEYFIQFEEQDFDRRQAIVDESQKEQQRLHNVPPLAVLPPPRRCPTAQEYLEAWIIKEPDWPSSAIGGAYTRFTMPDYKQRPGTMRVQAWHGAPIAAILHACRAVLGGIMPPEFVAPSIKKQLRKLQELYERRPQTGPGDNPSINLGELSLPDTYTAASEHVQSHILGSNTPSLPPPQPSNSTRDPLADQAAMQAHDAQQRSAKSLQAVSPTILDQTIIPIEASSEQLSKKRRRTSSSSAFLPQHRRGRRSPPTPALTREASTASQHASPGLHPHLPVIAKKGREEGKETREDPFSYVFRYHWKWGPDSSAQEKADRVLSLSQKEVTHLLD